MWPRLATAPTPTPAEAGPESAPDGTARRALAQLLGEIAEVSAKAARLAEIDRQRRDAEAEEAAALAGCEVVAAAEQDDMAKWSSGGCQGAPPQPRAGERATGQERLAGAKARAEAARHSALAVQDQLAAANAAAAQLEARRRTLIAAVLVEHARDLAVSYSKALGTAVRHEIVLAALRRQLADLGNVEAGMAVALLMRRGSGPDPTVSKGAADALRRQIAAFVERLALDADTPFPSDGANDGEE